MINVLMTRELLYLDRLAMSSHSFKHHFMWGMTNRFGSMCLKCQCGNLWSNQHPFSLGNGWNN